MTRVADELYNNKEVNISITVLYSTAHPLSLVILTIMPFIEAASAKKLILSQKVPPPEIANRRGKQQPKAAGQSNNSSTVL